MQITDLEPARLSEFGGAAGIWMTKSDVWICSTEFCPVGTLKTLGENGAAGYLCIVRKKMNLMHHGFVCDVVG